MSILKSAIVAVALAAPAAAVAQPYYGYQPYQQQPSYQQQPTYYQPPPTYLPQGANPYPSTFNPPTSARQSPVGCFYTNGGCP